MVKSLIRVAVTGGAGQIAYSLLFRIASGEMFGQDQPIALNILELAVAFKGLEGVKMELEDCAFPLLKEINIGTDPIKIFQSIDFALLIGASPRGVGMERSDLLKENGKIFIEQGKALDISAKKSVKVLVVGNPCNTNCLIAMKNAKTIPQENFFSMTRLDQNRGVAQLAMKGNVSIDAIKKFTIWGNHSSTQVPDFFHGNIKGQSIEEAIKDSDWLHKDFIEIVQKRGAAIISARGKSSAASAASAIIDTIKSLIHKTAKDEAFSIGIYSANNPYDIDEDLIFSFPCRSLGDCKIEIIKDLKCPEFLKKKIKESELELIEERSLSGLKRGIIMEEKKSEILFEITKDQLDTGLRGFPVGYCSTSSVNPTKGLIYIDKTIKEVAELNPEQVIYLLYNGKEASSLELKHFSENLHKRSIVSKELVAHILQLPRKGDPMKLFSAALLLCQVFHGTNNYREDCLNLIAKIPEIVATVINYHAGWGTTKPSRPELGYMENFAHMLNVPNGDKEQLSKIFKLFNILHFDHGGGNLSTFVGKAISSGLEDMYGSICGAMCALDGSKHGRANQDSLEFVESLLEEIGSEASYEKIAKALEERLANNELIFGFGHAVLRVEDPRATVLYEKAKRKYAENPKVKIALLMREVAPKILLKNPKIADPYPNVDAISGVLLDAAGFPYKEYFTVLFGLARVVGISIQIVDERISAREGKGTPIVRPKYLFKPREN